MEKGRLQGLAEWPDKVGVVTNRSRAQRGVQRLSRASLTISSGFGVLALLVHWGASRDQI